MKRFIDILIPSSPCNLCCHYCYVPQETKQKNCKSPFLYSAKHVGRALSKKRLGGICHFNACGIGETLIPEQVTDIIREILKNGHYVMIVTNGTLTKRFRQFARFPKHLKERLGFKFSFHYLELAKRGMLDIFFGNVELVKKSGMSFSVELMPSDELEPYIEDVKKICVEKVGALPHTTIPRNETVPGIELLSKHPMNEFYKIWENFDSEMLRFKKSTWGVKRHEYCYAGAWSGLLNVGSGVMTACYWSKITQNIFEDLKKPIKWVAVGKCCNLPHCVNSHSLLALGDIPQIKGVYADIRNRKNEKDGTEWLRPKMKEFLSRRLENYNKQFTVVDKMLNYFRKRSIEKKNLSS
jgi:MoaA/NifB/PqqE/SkfB family radical SAM enzyme